MFRIIGVNNTNLSDNGLVLNSFGAYFVQVFLNGTGNGNGPTYEFWVAEGIRNPHSIIPNIMIGIGWTLWILNSFFINVIMMNFLIAIVFSSYDAVMSNSIQNRYSQKCEMNRECRLMLKFLGLNPRRDVFILSANTTVDEDKWNGLVKTVKDSIKTEIHSLRE